VVLEPDADKHEIIERVAALDIGKATLVRRTRIPGQGRSRAGSGGHRALDDDPVVAADDRSAARARGDAGGDGGDQ